MTVLHHLLNGVLPIILTLLSQPGDSLIASSPCTFLCGDGLTCLPDHQVCDGYSDCPLHEGGEGEDESVCSKSQEEEETGNSLETGRKAGDTVCQGAQTSLVADPTDCRVFYHCEESLVMPQSCGELMFNPRRQTCDWPRKVMQIRPECRNPSSFIFRLGPKSWDSRRTQRMLPWLGTSSPARLHQARPQVVLGLTHNRGRILHRLGGTRLHTPVTRTQSVQVQDQQSVRIVPASQPVSPMTPVAPPRLIVPNVEAPRPHVVRIEPTHRFIPRQQQHQVVVQQPLPQQAVPQQVVPQRIVSQQIVSQPVVTYHTVPTPISRHTYKEEHDIKEQDNLKKKISKEKDLKSIISNLVTERLRASLPKVLSGLRTNKVAKQTKVKQEPVKRVTHTVTSTSSQVNPGPSHHYTQDTVVGNQEDEDINESKDSDFLEPEVVHVAEVSIDFSDPEITEDQTNKLTELSNQEMKENTGRIVPKLSPILVEETREHKPVWTVTRERPMQLKRPDIAPEEDLSSGPRVLQKVRRKLFEDDRAKLKERRRILWKAASKDKKMENVEKKRRVLLKQVPEKFTEEQRLYQELGDVLEELKDATLKSNISVGFGNSLEEDLNEEERKAIEEAYNTNIDRMEEADMERNPANRLLEMMLQDYQQRQNVNSKEEEQYIETSEFRQNGDSLDERHNMDYTQMGEYRDSIENMDYVDYSDSSRQYMDSNQMRNQEYS